jgi:YegS/Rv2252/BmrU family lipid kinase
VKALFILNEKSGRRRDLDVRGSIARACAGWTTEVLPCSRKEDLDAMIERAEGESFDVVFAVGGDGTVHETAKRLVHRKPALGILPTGSGNGFARHIGLPMELEAALDALQHAGIETIDTAEVNGERFLGVMGVGFDALVADRFASSTTRGLETYIREGVKSFADFRAEAYEIVANGETLRKQAYVVAIANSGQYGNNAWVAPLASLRDGLLDVVIVNDTSLVNVPLLLARLFAGTFHRSNFVTTLQASEITLRRPSAGPAHLDGEPVSLGAELQVRVVPQSLRVLVPHGVRAF